MKFFILISIFSLNVFAYLTPAQKEEIRNAATKVMFSEGAEIELNAKITSFSILAESRDLITARFTYQEELFSKRTCTFVYDLKLKKTIKKSVTCSDIKF